MDAQKYIEMIRDKHFFDYKKMEYKYSKDMMTEMLQLLYTFDAKELPLKDKKNQKTRLFLSNCLSFQYFLKLHLL